VQNDNTTSRFAFSWQQVFSSGCLAGNNATSTANVLMHLKIKYATGGLGQLPNLCFESSSTFDNQTFTACGPLNCTNANCTVTPGVQITNDDFDCTEAILPVELLYFQAFPNENRQVELRWKTMTEINSNYFQVERSKDGRNFQPIERVKGAGFSTKLTTYETVDHQPFSGLNYYRLKPVDFDGSHTYSHIVSVDIAGKGGIHIFPNPTRHVELTVQFPKSNGEVVVFRLLDAFGKIVLTQSVGEQEAEAGIAQLDLRALPAGVYFLEIRTGGVSLFERVVVQ